MKYIADLHIHSHYSRATSQKLVPEQLFVWAQRKGLALVASGDLSHPQWLAEMRDKLQPAGQADGFYELKEPLAKSVLAHVPNACRAPVHFILSGEISCIYKKEGQVRKVHNVVFFPSFASAQKFQDRLDRIGNIRSDGRPILGLDSRNLFEIVLETDPRGVLIPAHIWTPWFSLLGSQSGFDSVQECFTDLTTEIFALETGLSSDPPMNWRLTQLDRFNLVSNSDAHSPENLAREANVFDTPFDYDSLFNALRDKNHSGFWGTLEFFPEEGKYHMDGHRKCNKMMRPSETIRNNGLCPVCGKAAVLGVNYRVEELADCEEGRRPENAKRFASLVPLPEVLAEVMNCGSSAKKVTALYEILLQKLGAELTILRDLAVEEIEKAAGPMTAEAIRRMRSGQVNAQPGYDGEYGIIRLFNEEEREQFLYKDALFDLPRKPLPSKPAGDDKRKPVRERPTSKKANLREPEATYGLNADQEAAVFHHGSPLLIQAGPGTGKTRVLTHWLAQLIRSGIVPANHTLGITFTNKAATEMRERLATLLGEEGNRDLFLSTFHQLGLDILRQVPSFFGRHSLFRIIATEDDPAFLAELQKKCGQAISQTELERISLIKGRLFEPDSLPENVASQLGSSFLNHFRDYETLLQEWNAVDFDDLIGLPVRLLRNDPELRRRLLQRFSAIAVDEFQDINQAQYELFRIFAIAAKEVCVIGDPDQSIYGFRGASPHYFEQFKQDLPQHRFVQLTRNYRSSQNILDASVQVLGEPQSQLHSDIPAEVKIQILHAATDRAEAELVVQKIEELLAGTTHFSMDSGRVARGQTMHGYSFGDIAILLRSRSLLPPLHEALARAGIPFESVQERPLCSDDFVQFVLAVLTYHLEKSPQTLKAIERFYPKAEGDLDPLFSLERQESVPNRIAAESTENKSLPHFCQAMSDWPQELTIKQMLALIRQASPVAAEDETVYRALNLLAANVGDQVQTFCDLVLLHKGVDVWDPAADRVRLLTLHAAKGLEFPIVFIIGCEEGIIPFAFGGRASQVEEEKRLFYVAMTRSRARLYLCHAKQRFMQGRHHSQSPSRFLAAISEKLVQKQKIMRKTKRGSGQLKLF